MSLAHQHFDPVLQDAYAFFGDGALYAARGGAGVPVRVLIDGNLSQYGEVARVAGKTVVVSLRVSEVPDLPRSGDTVSVTSGPYQGRALRVDSVLESDALEHKVLAA